MSYLGWLGLGDGDGLGFAISSAFGARTFVPGRWVCALSLYSTFVKLNETDSVGRSPPELRL